MFFSTGEKLFFRFFTGVFHRTNKCLDLNIKKLLKKLKPKFCPKNGLQKNYHIQAKMRGEAVRHSENSAAYTALPNGNGIFWQKNQKSAKNERKQVSFYLTLSTDMV